MQRFDWQRFLLLMLLVALASPCPAAETRTALVIGNGAYTFGMLKNPVNDATDISAALKELGFDVIQRENATLREMEEALDAFWSRLKGGGVGLFYFAGHGLQVQGRNYLVPVDARIEVEQDVKFECLDAGKVLGRMEAAGNSLNLVFLDACRNNPFARSFRSAQRGLAQVDAPIGTFIAYATAPGAVAADGDGRNGVFTEHLLRNMEKRGLEIEQVMKLTRVDVMRTTDSRQVPWQSSSLTGRFYFRPPDRTASQNNEPDLKVIERQTREREESLFWETIKDEHAPEPFEAYLARYPDGTFAPLARLSLQKLQREATNPSSFSTGSAIADIADVRDRKSTYIQCLLPGSERPVWQDRSTCSNLGGEVLKPGQPAPLAMENGWVAMPLKEEQVFLRKDDERQRTLAAIESGESDASIGFSIDNKEEMQPLRITAEGELVQIEGDWYAHFKHLRARLDTDLRDAYPIRHIKVGMFWRLKRQGSSDYGPEYQREYINAGTLPFSIAMSGEVVFEKSNFWIKLAEKPYLRDPLPNRVTKYSYSKLKRPGIYIAFHSTERNYVLATSKRPFSLF